jgi:hypothetical protein
LLYVLVLLLCTNVVDAFASKTQRDRLSHSDSVAPVVPFISALQSVVF